jgi:hypothetical protein
MSRGDTPGAAVAAVCAALRCTSCTCSLMLVLRSLCTCQLCIHTPAAHAIMLAGGSSEEGRVQEGV